MKLCFFLFVLCSEWTLLGLPDQQRNQPNNQMNQHTTNQPAIECGVTCLVMPTRNYWCTGTVLRMLCSGLCYVLTCYVVVHASLCDHAVPLHTAMPCSDIIASHSQVNHTSHSVSCLCVHHDFIDDTLVLLLFCVLSGRRPANKQPTSHWMWCHMLSNAHA